MTSVIDTILNTHRVYLINLHDRPSEPLLQITQTSSVGAKAIRSLAEHTNGARMFVRTHTRHDCRLMQLRCLLSSHFIRSSSWAARRHSLHFPSGGVLVRSACAQLLRDWCSRARRLLSLGTHQLRDAGVIRCWFGCCCWRCPKRFLRCSLSWKVNCACIRSRRCVIGESVSDGGRCR
jgi:hypothetical protein